MDNKPISRPIEIGRDHAESDVFNIAESLHLVPGPTSACWDGKQLVCLSAIEFRDMFGSHFGIKKGQKKKFRMAIWESKEETP